VLGVLATLGVVLGALYMLRLAQRLLFGEAKVPGGHATDLDLREKAILAAIVVAIFALGLMPAEPLGKTEAAALHYQSLVLGTQQPGAAP
jgi:NADH-quinone oxidoreductase subunit M